MGKPDPLWDRTYYDFLEKAVAPSEVKHILELEKYIDSLPSKHITRVHANRVLDLLAPKGCEKSYFAAFLRTCDVSAAELLEEGFFTKKEREETLAKIIGQYKKSRAKGIHTDVHSLQAYNDGQTAKRRSSSGEDKVITISGLREASSLKDLDGKIAKINKSSGEFAFSKIKETFGISLSLNKEGKVPDCIFQFGQDVYLLEAKHVRRQGGAQNGSLSELIAFVNLAQARGKFRLHFVSFLDGSYPKYLSVAVPKEKGTKLEKQKFQILSGLKKNPQNFFVGTAGLKALFRDI